MADTHRNNQEGPFDSFGRRVSEGVSAAGPFAAGHFVERETERVRQELRRILDHLNDEVVPQVRRESAQALHAAAEQISKLARRLDDAPLPPASDRRPSGGDEK